MKRFILTLLACLLTTAASPAVTLNFNGRIDGGPGTPQYIIHTLDYYFLTALVGGTFTGSLCLVADPRDGGGTSLDFNIYRSTPNTFGEFEPVSGFGLFHNAPCDSRTFTLPAGDYIMVARPRSSFWDGGQGTIDATSKSDKSFANFAYDGSLTGDFRLNAIWLGQLDGTFIKTTVPEPGVLTLLLSAVLTQCLTRQKFPA